MLVLVQLSNKNSTCIPTDDINELLADLLVKRKQWKIIFKQTDYIRRSSSTALTLEKKNIFWKLHCNTQY